ncbi:ubiquitin carboxyl-terminal hydrolase 20 [Octopus bimaculoides]|uniref:ubiquitin carboxyl-terminal hydrolase 20 n=1 Tax=Octopus bimaculoides TaxID=37653 RepID=UPI0022E95BB4|nr:ubiquitin carboxyl-terminal hydrolase 20 [Octopus bimaculoides]
MRQSSNCPHVHVISENQSWEICKKHDAQECHTCHAQPPNLWLCLVGNCNYIGCGESSSDHSGYHAVEHNHCLTINLTTMRIWCYSCENEVLDHNSPPLQILDRPYQMLDHQDVSTDSSPQRSAFEPEDSESDMDDDTIKPRGLTGLQNLGNSCYMNAALQALSNCPPLTRFFLDCYGFVRPDRNPMLSRHYLRLISEIWHKKRPSYVVPNGIANGIKSVHPMFKGYTQQDTQEFLRCFMDQLHEELKQPMFDMEVVNSVAICSSTSNPLLHESTGKSSYINGHERQSSIDSSSSHSDYETCDSAPCSERGGTPEVNLSGDESSDTSEMTQLSGKKSNFKVVTGGGGGSYNDMDNNENVLNHSTNCKDGADLNVQIESMTDNKEFVTVSKEMKDTVNLLYKQTSSQNEAGIGTVSEPSDDPAAAQTTAATTNKAFTNSELHDIPSDGETKTKTASTAKVKSEQSHTENNPKTSKIPTNNRSKRPLIHQSVISDIFDGRLLSSVQCLTCERISTTKETFQDLSLPIPSKDHLLMLHANQSSNTKGGACGEVNQGWVATILMWLKSWIMGPTITLQDCLSAFFSADELKGDNMYSCDKCKKLRNGMKYSKVLRLPEILCIHLKRFRHEFYSSKINTYVSFPLEGLNMKPYLHKDCQDEVTSYDLMSVICHHGTAGGGHYTAYCLNYVNEQWYEFDDQYVTEVDFQQVLSSSAYVLFYRKQNEHMLPMRESAMALMEEREVSFLRTYMSKQWINRFNTFAEPGPITNQDFLCSHGGVPPSKIGYVENLVVLLSQPVWQYLHDRFGGGPACTHLIHCKTCEAQLEKLKIRQNEEIASFVKLHNKFRAEEDPSIIYAISMAWFKEWENFVRAKTDTPPDAIDNTRIMIRKNGKPVLKSSSDHGQLSREMWQFLHNVYGGGPELIVRQHPTLATITGTGGSSGSGTGGGGGGVSGSCPGNAPPISAPPQMTTNTATAMTTTPTVSPAPATTITTTTTTIATTTVPGGGGGGVSSSSSSTATTAAASSSSSSSVCSLKATCADTAAITLKAVAAASSSSSPSSTTAMLGKRQAEEAGGGGETRQQKLQEQQQQQQQEAERGEVGEEEEEEEVEVEEEGGDVVVLVPMSDSVSAGTEKVYKEKQEKQEQEEDGPEKEEEEVVEKKEQQQQQWGEKKKKKKKKKETTATATTTTTAAAAVIDTRL